MSKRNHIPLDEAFGYNPDTGDLTWLTGTRKHLHAGCQMADGSIEVTFQGSTYRGHHLAWFLGHGEWPMHYIGHHNKDRGDNRLDNLFEIVSLKNLKEMQGGVV